MDRPEATKCIEMMMVIWPRSVPEDEALQRWTSHFATLDETVVLEIIDKLEKTYDNWPTWHQFHALIYPTLMAPDIKQPLFNPVTPEERANVARLISEMRSALKSSEGEHRHGGPDPCPVCGGIKPTYTIHHAPA